MFLKSGSVIRRLASLPWPRAGPVRQLRRYYQGAMTACRPPRRASLPSLGGTSVALVLFAPGRTSAPPRPGVGDPVAPAGMCRGNDRLSQVLGEPRLSVCACSPPTPAGPLAPDPYSAAAWPWVIERQRLLRKDFRRSRAWLSDSLSTLRSAGYPAPRKTRFRPLVRRYRAGFPPARFRGKVSDLFPTSHPPFPSFLGAIDVTCAPKTTTQTQRGVSDVSPTGARRPSF